MERTPSQRESWSERGAPSPALAPPPPALSAARMVIFRAGGERFALPLEAVREVVVPQPPFARVPRAGAAVKGGMNLRGRVVAVVELAPLLGLAPDALGPAQGHVLVLERDRRGLGLLVAAVLGVDAVALPGPGAGEPGAPSRGVAAVRGAPVTVLDPETLELRAAALFGAAPT
ncbi:MAG: chemotaxis protein CheW [Anaeromyxobacteraceae bacterium]